MMGTASHTTNPIGRPLFTIPICQQFSNTPSLLYSYRTSTVPSQPTSCSMLAKNQFSCYLWSGSEWRHIVFRIRVRLYVDHRYASAHAYLRGFNRVHVRFARILPMSSITLLGEPRLARFMFLGVSPSLFVGSRQSTWQHPGPSSCRRPSAEFFKCDQSS